MCDIPLQLLKLPSYGVLKKNSAELDEDQVCAIHVQQVYVLVRTVYPASDPITFCKMLRCLNIC